MRYPHCLFLSLSLSLSFSFSSHSSLGESKTKKNVYAKQNDNSNNNNETIDLIGPVEWDDDEQEKKITPNVHDKYFLLDRKSS